MWHGLRVLRRCSGHRSCMTTPSWRWPAFWATAHGNGRACSANCNRITYSPIGLADPARATTKARWRVWSGWSGGTTWCRFRMRRRFRGAQRTIAGGLPPPTPRRSAARPRRDEIGARLARDQACFHDLPVSPYDAWREAAGPGQLAVAGALSQHRLLECRPPTAIARFLIRGYVDNVVISCGADIIAPARALLRAGKTSSLRPAAHYLALLERKIGALDQAAPLAGWDLPEAFTMLRRLLEARMGKQGKREFVQVRCDCWKSSRSRMSRPAFAMRSSAALSALTP